VQFKIKLEFQSDVKMIFRDFRFLPAAVTVNISNVGSLSHWKCFPNVLFMFTHDQRTAKKKNDLSR
jgi:hypothetical protein